MLSGLSLQRANELFAELERQPTWRREAAIYLELTDTLGLKPRAIAKRVRHSWTYIENRALLATMSPKVLDLIGPYFTFAAASVLVRLTTERAVQERVAKAVMSKKLDCHAACALIRKMVPGDKPPRPKKTRSIQQDKAFEVPKFEKRAPVAEVSPPPVLAASVSVDVEVESVEEPICQPALDPSVLDLPLTDAAIHVAEQVVEDSTLAPPAPAPETGVSTEVTDFIADAVQEPEVQGALAREIIAQGLDDNEAKVFVEEWTGHKPNGLSDEQVPSQPPIPTHPAILPSKSDAVVVDEEEPIAEVPTPKPAPDPKPVQSAAPLVPPLRPKRSTTVSLADFSQPLERVAPRAPAPAIRILPKTEDEEKRNAEWLAWLELKATQLLGNEGARPAMEGNKDAIIKQMCGEWAPLIGKVDVIRLDKGPEIHIEIPPVSHGTLYNDLVILVHVLEGEFAKITKGKESIFTKVFEQPRVERIGLRVRGTFQLSSEKLPYKVEHKTEYVRQRHLVKEVV